MLLPVRLASGLFGAVRLGALSVGLASRPASRLVSARDSPGGVTLRQPAILDRTAHALPRSPHP
ncbi:hypothetical protein [Plantactinospora sp. GCM10030261]|uniref:hypothetical protein n=1 Tax=Plantactinospora sp. GCM10030261 TaxID=3273420 RepID=UPI0036136047